MLPHSCYKKPPSNSEGAEVDAAAVTETALYLDFEIFFFASASVSIVSYHFH